MRVEKSILRATTLQWCSKGVYVAVIQLSHGSRTAVKARNLPVLQFRQRHRGCRTLSHLPQLQSCVPYHGIHFPFFGSMSFRGMNLIQPSRLASFLSGTWPMYMAWLLRAFSMARS